MLVCVVERRTLFEPHFAPSRKRSPLSGIYAAYLFRYEPPVALWRKISEGYVEWPQSPLNTGRCIQKHFLMDGDTPSLAPFNTSRPPLKSVFSGDLWTVCRPRENPPPPPSPFLFFLFFSFFFFYRGNGFARPNVLKTKNVRACAAIHVSGDSNGRIAVSLPRSVRLKLSKAVKEEIGFLNCISFWRMNVTS